MLEQSDLLVIAEGATHAAQSYIMECLGIPVDASLAQRVSNDQLKSMLLALTITTLMLETTIKVNVRNPELRAQLRSMMEATAEKISKMAIARLETAGIITSVNGQETQDNRKDSNA